MSEPSARPGSETPRLTRRTLARTAAWTTPVIAMGAAAPAVAASAAPGLQGYVTVAKQCAGTTMTLTINGTGTYPDKGLWVFNAQPSSLSNAAITFYYPSSLGTISWSAAAGNSGWSTPTVDSTAPQISGFTAYTTKYTGSWTYVSTSAPPYSFANGQPNFTATVTATTARCSDGGVSVYARRTVDVDGTTIAFQRGPVSL